MTCTVTGDRPSHIHILYVLCIPCEMTYQYQCCYFISLKYNKEQIPAGTLCQEIL